MKSLGNYEPICSLICYCYWNLFEPSTRWEVGVVSCLTLKILGHLLAQGAICDAMNAHWPCLEGPDFEFLKKKHQEWVVHLWLVVSGISWYFNFQHLKTQCFGWVTTSEISGMLNAHVLRGTIPQDGCFWIALWTRLPIPVLYQWEYHQKIWPYMVQYLHFRILNFPLTGSPRWQISGDWGIRNQRMAGWIFYGEGFSSVQCP